VGCVTVLRLRLLDDHAVAIAELDARVRESGDGHASWRHRVQPAVADDVRGEAAAFVPDEVEAGDLGRGGADPTRPLVGVSGVR
jgi:hypothetical protein